MNNIIPVKVDKIGIYCIKFLSSLNAELGGYNQSQCVNSNTTPDVDGKYEVRFEVPYEESNYIIPKVRVYENSTNGYFQDFLNIPVYCIETTTSSTSSTTTTTPITGTVNYLLWEPDVVEDDFLVLQVTSLNNGTFTLTDIGDNQGLTCYYKINGASNPLNAKLLSTYPVPGNTEIHVLKFGHSPQVTNANDPNGIMWRTYFDAENPLPAKIGCKTINIQYNA